MKRVYLEFAPNADQPGGWVALRDLCGEDEEAVDGTDTAQAIALLDRLLLTERGAALGSGEANALTSSDRDRLLAAVFQAEFGARIDCVLRCDACGAPFDIDFRLPDLMASLGVAPGSAPCHRGDEVLVADCRVRLPRGEDELALHGVPPDLAAQTLLERCLIEGTADPDDPAMLEALERAAPLIDADLDATCPECGAAALAHFDLQHFLLTAIEQESPVRTAEIHLLARTYGWSLGEILALRRQRRRAFAMAIERDRGVNAVDW